VKEKTTVNRRQMLPHLLHAAAAGAQGYLTAITKMYVADEM